MCGRVDFSMYMTRGGALNWHSYRVHLVGFGFAEGSASPFLFFYCARQIRIFVHRDDISMGKSKDVCMGQEVSGAGKRLHNQRR